MALQSITGMKPYPLPEPTDVGPIETELKGATAKREQAFEKVQRLEELGIQRKRAEEETKATVDYEQTRELAKRARDFVKEQETMPEAQTLKRKREEMQDMAFVPSRANMEELATLFSLIGVVGVAIGAGGKQNALAAMSAMNGMVEGYNKGRTDIYKREKDQFEAYVKNQRVLMENLVKDYEQALKLRQANKEAGDLEVKSIFAKYGADQLKAISEKYGDAKGIEIAKNVLKDATDAETRVKSRLDKERDFNLKVAEAQRRLLAEQRTREHQQRMESRGQKQIFQGSDGKMYTFDMQTREVQPIDTPEGVTLAKPSGRAASPSGGGGAVQFRYNAAMTNAGNALAMQVRNIAGVPLEAAPPMLAETLTNPAKGVSDAVVAFLGGQITEPENRAVQQILAGMSRAITTIESSGRPSGATEASIKDFGKVAPKAGDKKINYYLFLAETKQVMDVLVKDLEASGGNEKQLEMAKTARDEVGKVVTWTVDDINRILAKDRPRLVDDKVRQQLKTSNAVSDFEPRPGNLPRPTTQAEYDALPPGSLYIDPDDNKQYRKPEKK